MTCDDLKVQLATRYLRWHGQHFKRASNLHPSAYQQVGEFLKPVYFKKELDIELCHLNDNWLVVTSESAGLILYFLVEMWEISSLLHFVYVLFSHELWSSRSDSVASSTCFFIKEVAFNWQHWKQHQPLTSIPARLCVWWKCVTAALSLYYQRKHKISVSIHQIYFSFLNCLSLCFVSNTGTGRATEKFVLHSAE